MMILGLDDIRSCHRAKSVKATQLHGQTVQIILKIETERHDSAALKMVTSQQKCSGQNQLGSIWVKTAHVPCACVSLTHSPTNTVQLWATLNWPKVRV